MQYQSSSSHKVDNRYRGMQGNTDNQQALRFLKAATERMRQSQAPNIEFERSLDNRFNFDPDGSFRNQFRPS